ncbi:MAG: hypothetical protein JJ911_03575 [Rhizobiaceae bacterium]|nr:hypothetical protein [Rhizobiaceae bacterium]
MATKGDLVDWVHDALVAAGGAATIIFVAEHIWKNHRTELEQNDLFYTWQYDMRWAATELRKRGVMVAASDDRRGKWTLK